MRRNELLNRMAHGLPLLLLGVVLVAGCSGGPGRTGVDDPLQSVLEVTAAPSPDEVASPSTAVETNEPPPSAGAVGQTETAWGRIWDGLPPGFPIYPDATATDRASSGEPVSAAFTAEGVDPAEIAQWLQTELEVATYSTEALSGPLEDGSFVIDSVGEGDCRIESVVTPAGDTTLLTVRFGAACPFE